MDENQTSLIFIRAKRGGKHEATSAKRPPFERSEIYGGVAEWLKAPVSKTGILERVS